MKCRSRLPRGASPGGSGYVISPHLGKIFWNWPWNSGRHCSMPRWEHSPVVIFGCPFFSDVLPDPIAFWPLNKQSGTSDLGPYKINSTSHGATLTTGQKGRPDSAYHFQETSHSAIHIWKGSAPLDELDDFTILLVIKPVYPYPVPIWTWRTAAGRVGCALRIDEAGELVFTGEGMCSVRFMVGVILPSFLLNVYQNMRRTRSSNCILAENVQTLRGLCWWLDCSGECLSGSNPTSAIFLFKEILWGGQ
jgi:hypothetical protein